MTPLTARLADDPVDLARIDNLVRPPYNQKLQRRLLYLDACLGIAYLALGSARLYLGGRNSDIGYIYVVSALGYVSIVAAQIVRLRNRDELPKPSGATVTISELGLTFNPSAEQLPRRKLTCVSDVDGFFVFLDAF